MALSLCASALAADKGKTLKNLNQAFQSEAKAAAQYGLFAQKADEDGLAQMAKLFRATAKSESIHRDNHAVVIRELGGKAPQIKSSKLEVSSTSKNVESLIKAETRDSEKTYPKYIKQAGDADLRSALETFEWARRSEAGHLALFKAAQVDLLRDKRVDYYVDRTSGAVLEVPAGKGLSATDRDRYIQVG